MKSALLIHAVDWCSEEASFELEGGVRLCRTEGTDVDKLYRHLCQTQNIDESDPYNFQSHIVFPETAHDELFPYWGGPFSEISRCCNIITVCTSKPPGMCRLICSEDNFQSTSIPSIVIYEQHPDADTLRAYPDFLTVSSSGSVTITDESCAMLNEATALEIASCWGNQRKLLSSRDVDNHRIENALSYFFYAWRSYYLDHICLNLAVVLESLFSPSSAHEVSHQIAFNVSRFCEKAPHAREATYRTIKSFYALRSQIVHGGKARHRDLCMLTPQVFHLCAGILKTILGNYPLASQFCQEAERRRLFDEWMFS
jgi:hypothetical protein